MLPKAKSSPLELVVQGEDPFLLSFGLELLVLEMVSAAFLIFVYFSYHPNMARQM